MIIVSACLAGCCCRYDGRDNGVKWVRDLVAEGKAFPFCPEQMGGLVTPREPSEIQKDGPDGNLRVVSRDGKDLTGAFLLGAEEGMKLVELAGVRCAVLKERSPSCGVHKVYSGFFDGTLIPGEGIMTKSLRQFGVAVFSEDEEALYKVFSAKVFPVTKI